MMSAPSPLNNASTATAPFIVHKTRIRDAILPQQQRAQIHNSTIHQTYDSPSGRLRDREKEARSKRNQYKSKWNASAELKYIHNLATVVASKNGPQQTAIDYFTTNTRLIAHQSRLQSAKQQQQHYLQQQQQMPQSQHQQQNEQREDEDSEDDETSLIDRREFTSIPDEVPVPPIRSASLAREIDRIESSVREQTRRDALALREQLKGIEQISITTPDLVSMNVPRMINPPAVSSLQSLLDRPRSVGSETTHPHPAAHVFPLKDPFASSSSSSGATPPQVPVAVNVMRPGLRRQATVPVTSGAIITSSSGSPSTYPNTNTTSSPAQLPSQRLLQRRQKILQLDEEEKGDYGEKIVMPMEDDVEEEDEEENEKIEEQRAAVENEPPPPKTKELDRHDQESKENNESPITIATTSSTLSSPPLRHRPPLASLPSYLRQESFSAAASATAAAAAVGSSPSLTTSSSRNSINSFNSSLNDPASVRSSMHSTKNDTIPSSSSLIVSRQTSLQSQQHHPNSSSPTSGSVSTAVDTSFASALPPASSRLYPKELIGEMDAAHKVLAKFIAMCQAEIREVNERMEEEMENGKGEEEVNMVEKITAVYWKHFSQLLQSCGLDANGFTSQPSSPHITPSSTNTTTTSSIPPAHITLCASYILVQLCDTSSLFPHHRHNEFLMSIINTLLYSIYDITYEENSMMSIHTRLKRTPFFIRYKYLQQANHDIMQYKQTNISRLRYNTNSLRMVISHMSRRLMRMCWRAWKQRVKVEKRRRRMGKLHGASGTTGKKKGGATTGKDITSSSSSGTDLIRCFLFWRAYSHNHKLHRLLTGEITKLNTILSNIHKESLTTHEGNITLSEQIQILLAKLVKLEEEKLSSPLKPDLSLMDPLIHEMFERAEKQLEGLKSIQFGFVPLWKMMMAVTGGRGRKDDGTTGKSKKGNTSNNNHAPSNPSSTTVQESLHHTDTLLKQFSLFSKKETWDTRSTLFSALKQAREEEEVEEGRVCEELERMESEDFIVLWTNYVLMMGQQQQQQKSGRGVMMMNHNEMNDASARLPSTTTSPPLRKLRDLSTDLRDSTLYTTLLSTLSPELPTQKVSSLYDLHSKAKLVLSLSSMIGVRLMLNEYEYVEGIPDLHLLFLCAIFQAKHGLRAEPSGKWFEGKRNRMATLREHWSHLRTLEAVPPITAYSFLGHLYQLCNEVDVLKSRLLRRSTSFQKIQHKVSRFMWMIQRARLSGVAEEYYSVHHINNRYHSYIESGTIESLLENDMMRMRHRLKYEHKHKHTSNTAADQQNSSNLTKKQRHQLLLDDEEAIENEISNIKRIFAIHRVELRKIQKHYCTDPQTNEIYTGIDYDSFAMFCKDIGLLSGTNKIPLASLQEIFQICLVTVKEQKDDDDIDASARKDNERSPGSADGMNITLTTDNGSSTTTPRLSPSQFLDSMIRLSNIKYLHQYPDTLYQRLQAIIEKDVLSGASRTIVDEFRKLLSSEQVRNVWRHNKSKLSSLFRKYSNGESGNTIAGAANEKSFTLSQFLQLLRDIKLLESDSSSSSSSSTRNSGSGNINQNSNNNGLTTLMSVQRAKLMFQNVQQDEDYGSVDPTQSESLSYQEYLEAIGALACWSYPDPFMSLAQKIESFLERTLFQTKERD